MKSWLKSRHFFVQILVFTISFLLMLCILFTGILYINARKSTTTAIFQSESERNANLLLQSDIYWSELISVGSSFSNLTVPYKELITAETYWTRMLFDSMVNSHIKSNKYISNIDVEIDGNSMSPSQLSHEKQLGKFYIFEIYGSSDSAWPYSFDLVLDSTTQFNQVTITLKGHYLSNQIFPTNTSGRQEYLLTEDNVVLLTNQSNAYFQSADQLLPGIDLVKSDTSELKKYKEFYYVISEADKYGFRILSLLPQDLYSSQYTSVMLQTALMAAFLFLLTLFISIFLTVRFYRPIKNTVDLLLTYIPNDIHEYENEIAFIHQNITKYIIKENAAEPTASKNFHQIQNNQTAVLQYQINSHFLFNTLENIKAISILNLGMNNEIENSIILLNSIIREGIFQKNIIVPLSHELHLAKCYLNLMRMRFPDVEIYWSEEEALSSCQVFKFSLQPVLENCFAHAFKGKVNRPKQIHITISRKLNDLSILILDNGVGFTSGTSLNPDALPETSGQVNSSGHVGILNVHNRITDMFGINYGIRISAANPGTAVEILYPIVHPINSDT